MVSNPVEIANVFSRGLEVTWCIERARPFVPGNSRNRLERLDLIERRNPLLAAFRIRLAQMKMNIIVERIAADGQSDGRDMQTGCAIGIGMPERNTYELFPFQFEKTALEFVGDHEHRIDLSGKAWFPICLNHRNRRLLSHNRDDFARRDEPRPRKFLLDCVYAKEMIAVAVGCVDCRQILAAARDPVDKFLVLIDGNRRVHEHGIALARNKRRRNGRPFHFACSWWKFDCDHRDLGTDKNVPLQSIGHHASSICRFCFDGAAMLAQPATSDKRVSTLLSRSLATVSASEFRYGARRLVILS